jgi:hypothetical protein
LVLHFFMNQSSPAYCHAKLPKSGLGNKLFVWAKAHVFARLNHLPLVVTGWAQLQLAPILHGRDFRFYWNYFRPVKEVNWLKQAAIRRRAKIVEEPPVVRSELPSQPAIYEFSEIPHWSDYFGDLKAHREMIREALFEMLTPARRRELALATKTQISVQVRLGDFRPLKQDEDFAKVGGVRTPLTYFANIINGIREIHGTEVPVTVFSDGTAQQLGELLSLPAVSLATKQTAVVDMLSMAAGKVLVPSAGSTFGFWAGFLGGCAIIMHPNHIHKSIRPDSVNEMFYEGPAVGPANQWPELLQKNIRAIGVF